MHLVRYCGNQRLTLRLFQRDMLIRAGREFLIENLDQSEVLTPEHHVPCKLAFAPEKIFMNRPPERQALIAFAFLSGEGFVDGIKSALLDAERLNHRDRLVGDGDNPLHAWRCFTALQSTPDRSTLSSCNDQSG
jgi:hypothetical protein